MSEEAKVAARESAAPRQVGPGERWDEAVDVIVVGGGASGLPAALFARWLGNEVLLLEKAPELGGTANKAAFWYWIPNNERMHELGLRDGVDVRSGTGCSGCCVTTAPSSASRRAPRTA
jgi:3-oxosteroid 1-dehydrogenase